MGGGIPRVPGEGPHPLVRQLRFTRSEFARAIKGVGEADARMRIEPMNSISWNVGHLAWQEQRYFLTTAQGETPYPDIAQRFASGGPASTPPLAEVFDGNVLCASDLLTNPRFVRHREQLQTVGLRSVIVVPLLLGSRVIGAHWSWCSRSSLPSGSHWRCPRRAARSFASSTSAR